MLRPLARSVGIGCPTGNISCRINWCVGRYNILFIENDSHVKPPFLVVFGAIYTSLSYRPWLGDSNWALATLFIWTFSSISMNVMVTTLMLVRLIRARNEFTKALPNSPCSSIYGGVIAVIIESSAPVTVSGLCLTVTTIIWHTHKVMNTHPTSALVVLHIMFSLLYYSFCVSKVPLSLNGSCELTLCA